MNTTVKNILIFVAGAGLGSLATYRFVKNKCKQVMQEEIDSVIEHFSKRAAIDEAEHLKEMTDEEYHKQVHQYTDYNKCSVSELADGAHPFSGGSSKMGSVPYIIPETEFSNTFTHYDKLTLYYYDEDDTLADENEEIVANIDYIIGDENLNCFGVESNDTDIVYVRNDQLAIDYEVIRVYKSYQRDVMGITLVSDTGHPAGFTKGRKGKQHEPEETDEGE